MLRMEAFSTNASVSNATTPDASGSERTSPHSPTLERERVTQAAELGTARTDLKVGCSCALHGQAFSRRRGDGVTAHGHFFMVYCLKD